MASDFNILFQCVQKINLSSDCRLLCFVTLRSGDVNSYAKWREFSSLLNRDTIRLVYGYQCLERDACLNFWGTKFVSLDCANDEVRRLL